jgi:L-aspartate semialdehyde sulfurtransferase ferredoxin
MAMARRRLRLTFPSGLVHEPIIYRLAKDFDIVVNIRRADVRADQGWVVLELDGDDEVLDRGLAWLSGQGVQVDPIERDVTLP